jgi:hypothetical protein
MYKRFIDDEVISGFEVARRCNNYNSEAQEEI